MKFILMLLCFSCSQISHKKSCSVKESCRVGSRSTDNKRAYKSKSKKLKNVVIRHIDFPKKD